MMRRRLEKSSTSSPVVRMMRTMALDSFSDGHRCFHLTCIVLLVSYVKGIYIQRAQRVSVLPFA